MSRPLKCRRIFFVPGVTYFKPAGIPCKLLEENRLSMEEVEAIRLKDLECLEQVQCAEKMNISRATFQRILSSARKKVADSLLAGKALRIEGGNYELSAVRLKCGSGHEWDASIGGQHKRRCCPVCKNSIVAPLEHAKKAEIKVVSHKKSKGNKLVKGETR
jgi:uncharacterized protein